MYDVDEAAMGEDAQLLSQETPGILCTTQGNRVESCVVGVETCAGSIRGHQRLCVKVSSPLTDKPVGAGHRYWLTNKGCVTVLVYDYRLIYIAFHQGLNYECALHVAYFSNQNLHAERMKYE